jgi:hypothetical protein
MSPVHHPDWRSIPVVEVPIECIRPQKLAPDWRALLKVIWVMLGILEPRSGDSYPHLIQESPGVASYRIEDGHHRVTVLAILGRKTIRARVWLAVP